MDLFAEQIVELPKHNKDTFITVAVWFPVVLRCGVGPFLFLVLFREGPHTIFIDVQCHHELMDLTACKLMVFTKGRAIFTVE